jgi:phosphatidylserine/phosphatidylglycerophosphate/cardiolipin synthase-like enzyme
VQIAGLDLDPMLDLNGIRSGDVGYLPVGGRLADAAAAGAEVRILLAGKIAARLLPLPLLRGFRDSVRHADQLRSWRAAESEATFAQATLAGCVLVDYSGPLLGANHQKVVVIGRGGELTAFVGGIDLAADRFDSPPHDRKRLNNDRWGWHDAAVRLRGPAAARVHEIFAQRWNEAATLPRRWFLRRHPLRVASLNPQRPAAAPTAAVPQEPERNPEMAVRVLRSVPARKVYSMLPARRRPWQSLSASGTHEVYSTIVHALSTAQRYVYLEDQYLHEYIGGNSEFELYPHLLAAAARGAKVILVGSGVRDPDDPGLNCRPINRRLNHDLRYKIVDRLNAEDDADVAVYRVEHLTVHTKLLLVDDAFACIGSANMFSRSMNGTDSEVSTAVSTTTSLVRDLRVQLWAEHLRAPLTSQLRLSLEHLDLALGIWRPKWLPDSQPTSTWLQPGHPVGYEPTEVVLHAVWPSNLARGTRIKSG